jgi:hypothetical protein
MKPTKKMNEEKNYPNPFEPKDTYIFVRYKGDNHRKFRNKNFDLCVDHGNDTEILLTSKAMFECMKSWLIRYPFLSLASEIQLIKNKLGLI